MPSTLWRARSIVPSQNIFDNQVVAPQVWKLYRGPPRYANGTSGVGITELREILGDKPRYNDRLTQGDRRSETGAKTRLDDRILVDAGIPHAREYQFVVLANSSYGGLLTLEGLDRLLSHVPLDRRSQAIVEVGLRYEPELPFSPRAIQSPPRLTIGFRCIPLD